MTAFLESLDVERGASRHTVAAYRRDLAELEAFLDARRPRRRHRHRRRARAVRERRSASRGLAPATVRRRLAAARAFLRYRAGEGARTIGVRDVPLPRERRRVPRALTADQAIRARRGARRVAARPARPGRAGAAVRRRPARVGARRPAARRNVDRDAGLVRCLGKGGRERDRAVRPAAPPGRHALPGARPPVPRQGAAARRAGPEQPRPPHHAPGRVRPRPAPCRAPRACPTGSARTRCATPSRRTSWRAAATCAPCRSCSATSASARRRSTPTSRATTCARRSRPRIRGPGQPPRS